MMNKGLELIEAQQIFDVDHERLDVIVHPQSVVHSLVAYNDGGQIAQLGVPDMQTPIAAALRWPAARARRPPLDLAQYGSLTFEPPDRERFPCLAPRKPQCGKAEPHRSCSTLPMKSRLAPSSTAPLPSAGFPVVEAVLSQGSVQGRGRPFGRALRIVGGIIRSMPRAGPRTTSSRHGLISGRKTAAMRKQAGLYPHYAG